MCQVTAAGAGVVLGGGWVGRRRPGQGVGEWGHVPTQGGGGAGNCTALIQAAWLPQTCAIDFAGADLRNP